MQTPESKLVVFQGILKAAPSSGRVINGDANSTLVGERERPEFYSILAQSRDELEMRENSPSISMWPFLVNTAQSQHLNEISIYSKTGTSIDQIRFLYLNDFALKIWREMGKQTSVLGRLHRPPRGAVLAFGMPFSD